MAEKQGAGKVPELWKNVEVDESGVLNLSIETRPEVEFGLSASVCL